MAACNCCSENTHPAISRKSFFRQLLGVCVTVLLLTLATVSPIHADPINWIVAGKHDSKLIWGRKDGLVFGLPSAEGMPGPRGLLRIGTFNRSTEQPELLNFIAIEPVVQQQQQKQRPKHSTRAERMAFSELEKSRMDPEQRGARLWVGESEGPLPEPWLTPEQQPGTPSEHLTVRVEIEPFPNGAHLYLLLTMNRQNPEELQLQAFPYPDSLPLEEVVFTATMGAYERLRFLWLRDRVIDSRVLYAHYAGPDFAEKEEYPGGSMLRNSDGDLLALSTSAERNPAAARNPHAKNNWYYSGPRWTQYWKIAARDAEENLRVRVNGRSMYWASKDLIPGGTTFENFELRERFKAGQTFIFGISMRPPNEWTTPLEHLGKTPLLN